MALLEFPAEVRRRKKLERNKLYNRIKYADPINRAKKRIADRKYHYNKYHSNPTYRAEALIWGRKYAHNKYHTDPVYRSKCQDRQREMYQTDPVYRSKCQDRQREKYRTMRDIDPIAIARRSAKFFGMRAAMIHMTEIQNDPEKAA